MVDEIALAFFSALKDNSFFYTKVDGNNSMVEALIKNMNNDKEYIAIQLEMYKRFSVIPAPLFNGKFSECSEIEWSKKDDYKFHDN